MKIGILKIDIISMISSNFRLCCMDVFSAQTVADQIANENSLIGSTKS